MHIQYFNPVLFFNLIDTTIQFDSNMKDQSKNDDNEDNDNDHDDHDDNGNDDKDNDNVDDRVEKTFQLLRDAKKFELEQKHWLATEKFVEAYQLLRILAEEENKKVADLATTTAAGTTAGTAAAAGCGTGTAVATTIAQNDDNNNNETGDDDNNDDGDNNDDDNSNTSEEEEEEEKIKNIKQIAQLYTSKANEYWKQSRQCLIQAMEQEKKLDSNKEIDETNSMSDNDTATDACLFPCASSCTLLDDDQARIRNYNFSLLFSRPIVGSVLPPVGVVEKNTTTTTTSDDDEISPLEENPNNPTPTSLIDQQWSLEERLQNLNKTLPSSFRSTEERMSEVNKGLNKLGLSLYTQKEPFARFATEELPKSEEEQIDEIMNQATDETNVEDQIIDNNNNDNINQSNKEEEEDEIFEDSDDDDDDDDDDEGDLLLDDDQLLMKSIQKKVVKAQIKLAEFLAILNEARSIKAKEDDIDDIDDDDDDDDKDSDDDSSFNDDIAKPDLAFSLLTSKIKLKGAQRDMRKALAEFDNISM
jgi:hypothetical protein